MIVQETGFAVAELSKAQLMLEKAKLVVIKTQDEAVLAQKELASIKTIQKEIEENRKSLVAPLNAQLSEINGAFKKPAEFLSSAETIIKGAIGVYLREQERLAREAQAKLEEAARKEQEKLFAQAQKADAKGKDETAQVLRETAINIVTPIVAAPQKLSGISVRKQWKAKVVDKTAFVKMALEREDVMALLLIDESKLNKLATMLQDSLKINGVEVYQDEIMSASRAA